MKKATLLVISVFYFALVPFAPGGVGQALYERWDGDGYEGGAADSLLRESSAPDYTEILTSTEWGVGDDDAIENYRARITGWFLPPVTGEYIFWIVSDDAGRLWISTDHDPANAYLIAEESSWAGEDGWGGVGDEAQSEPILLEGGKPYWLRGANQEGDGGDHIRIAWGSSDAGIANHTIISGQYITDDPELFYCHAYSPSPADGAINVPVEDVQLSWAAPALISDALYTVYFGSDANDLPELASGLTDTTVSTGTLLSVEETYAWRVDVLDPNEGGNPVLHTGNLWGFKTAPESPVIIVQPQEALVAAGETATFTIEYYSANGESVNFKWFKEDDPEPTLSTTDTLEIPGAQLADEGGYQCTITNSYGQVTSEPANLVIKRLLSHWPFDENLIDIVGGNEATSSKKVTYVEGIIDEGYGIEFGLSGGSGVEIASDPYITTSWTISFWEKANAEDAGDFWEVMVGSGGDWGYGILDVGRYRMSQYYLQVNWVDVYTPLTATYPRGEWNMLAVTYDGKAEKATLYLNGFPLFAYGVEFPGFDPTIYVGDSDTREYPYYGVMDDLKIYSYAMDPLDVVLIYADVVDETLCFENPDADVSGPEGAPDCVVDIYDIVELAGAWLECNLVPAENCL
jgi:hypothetical protein